MSIDVDSVRVALRIRPLVSSELERGCQEVVERIRGAQQVTVNRMEAFTFNYVFDARDSQQLVYNESVSVLLDKLFGGFNATILAYGQTGSGKTHTMGTAFNGELNEHAGVIPRAMQDIFRRIEQLQGEYEFVVTCSFMELYQEQLYDLLSTKTREESIIDLREDRNGIIIPGLTEQRVHSALETTDCLMRGSGGRAVASTAMNKESSRSHAIFTVTIQATKKDEMRTVTTSKFHLVDLAGSERSKKTLATGDRFKEGVKINQGLLALGNVISALGGSSQGSGFVRYRDSKLTRLLQDSLGGNSVTLMIACVSPADYNVPETLSTLRYADRARKIKNKPIVNQDPHAAEINHLKDVIQKLRMELLAVGGGVNASSLLSNKTDIKLTNGTAGVSATTTLGEMQGQLYQQLQEKYHNLQQQLQTTLHDVAENEMRAHIAEVAHDKLKTKTEQMKSLVNELKRKFTPDASQEQLLENIQRVQQIHELVEGMDEELERTQSEIYEHKRHCSVNSDVNSDDEEEHGKHEMHALMQDQTDAHNSKQMDIKEQLRRINRELNLKEELQHRVAENFTKFCTLDNDMGLKFKECESKIQELEQEKTELLDKLRHMKTENNTAKLAEERRKRLQALEQEINEMKRKNLQQAKLLKVREKETQKIKNLSSEIQAMKESKVKLIRSMRQESESFRQWKLLREKELMQLKNKDRKLQNEMVRKEALHTKQRNVLKRKCEEAMAINKRLKDALERQKVAQTQRQKMQPAKDANAATSKIDQVINAVERELEVIISLIDAEHSLEQLMEDRGIIKRQMGTVQQQQPQPPASDTAAAQELAQLEEELEMRNAQIADLQQKVCAADLDSRMRSLCEHIQSVGEARAVLRHLLKSIGEMRREYANRSVEQKSVLEEQCTLRQAAEERCGVAAKRMRLLEIEHEEAIAERENTYEEKIAVLLRELYNAPQQPVGTEITPEQQERLKIQEEQLDKMDALREELEHYKGLVTQLQQAVDKTQTKYGNRGELPKPILPMDDDCIIVDFVSSDEEDAEDDDDTEIDPDWRKTPVIKMKRSLITQGRRTTASYQSDSSHTDDTFVTAATSKAAHPNLKRRSSSCTCRGKCGTKRCGCRAGKKKCTRTCRCASDCNNGKSEDGAEISEVESEKSDVTSEENNKFSPPTNVNVTEGKNNNEAVFLKPETHLTPKIARLSTICFETASAKKKFFN